MKRGRLVSLAGVVGVIAVAGALSHESLENLRQVTHLPARATTHHLTPVRSEVRTPAAELRRRACGRARAHLDRADDECRRAVVDRIATIETFFDDAKRRTPEFAERVLGWDGQWRLIADSMPWTDGGRHERHVREAFRDCLFTPEQLEGQVRKALADYQNAVEDVEGETLVKVRADVADLPATFPAFTADPGELRRAFDGATARATELAAAGLRADVAGELVSIAVGEVLAQAAIRLGASAGILGAGAAAPATLGAGLAAGLIVDQVLSRAWQGWTDPRGGLAQEVGRKIDELRHAVVEGTADAPGLRARLAEADRRRAAARRSAVLGPFGENGGAP